MKERLDSFLVQFEFQVNVSSPNFEDAWGMQLLVKTVDKSYTQ